MIKEQDGKRILQYEVNAITRRIPIEKRGISPNGKEWLMATLFVEVYEGNEMDSVELMLTTFSEEMYETVTRIGVGKDVKIKFHIDTWQRNGRYSISCVLDSIEGKNSSENFIYGINKKGE